MLAWVGRFPYKRSLHQARTKAHSWLGSFTHPFQVIPPLPHLLLPPHQYFYMPRPNHPDHSVSQDQTLCNLLCLTTSAMHPMSSRLSSSALVVVLFKWTPHIHITVIFSVFSNLAIFSIFICHVSLVTCKPQGTRRLGSICSAYLTSHFGRSFPRP